MTKHFAGARIHTLRRRFGLTQMDMARRLGISTSYLNQLENDQRPLTVTVLMGLSREFDTPPEYFSADADARRLAELRERFPGVPDDQLADLTARYPDLVPRLLKHNAPEATAYEIVRDFYYAADNYFDALDRKGEELAQELGSPQWRVPRLVRLLEDVADITVNFRGAITGPAACSTPSGGA